MKEMRGAAIPILLVDDHPVVRLGYAALLRKSDSAFIFHEAGNRTEALELAGRHQPRTILLDLSLSDTAELSLIGELRAVAPGAPVLVVSMHDELLYAEHVLRAGAKGYLMKNHAAQSIAHAVRTVLDGEIWLSRKMREALMPGALAPFEHGTESIAPLGATELQVFRLLGRGLKKAEIAARLGITADAVDACRADIKRKLGIATGSELYRAAFLHFRKGDDGSGG
jgi:DNA-binding NarL/FixJ family response regulator